MTPASKIDRRRNRRAERCRRRRRSGGRLRIAVPFTIPGERVRVRLDRPAAAGASARPARSPARLAAPRSRRGAAISARRRRQALAPAAAARGSTSPIRSSSGSRPHSSNRLVRAAVPARSARAKPTLPATPLDQPWGYRNKVHFVFGNPRGRRSAHGPLRARFTPRHSGRRVSGPRRARQRVRVPRARHVHVGRPAARPTAIAAALRSLAIRVGCHTRELMATLVVSSDRDRRVRDGDAPSARRVRRRPRCTSTCMNETTHSSSVPATRQLPRLGADARSRWPASSFLMSPTAFFQTNVRAAEMLVRLVLDADPTDTPACSTCTPGSGLFAIPLAARGTRRRRRRREPSRRRRRRGRVEAERRAHAAGAGFVSRRVETALASIRRRRRRRARSAARRMLAVGAARGLRTTATSDARSTSRAILRRSPRDLRPICAQRLPDPLTAAGRHVSAYRAHRDRGGPGPGLIPAK